MSWKAVPRTSCCSALASSSEGPPRSASGAPAARSRGASVVDCTCLSRASPSASKTGMIAGSQSAGRLAANGRIPRATDRSRRSPTRNWCTCSGSRLPRAIPAALGRICARQHATIARSIAGPSIARACLALQAGARALTGGPSGSDRRPASRCGLISRSAMRPPRQRTCPDDAVAINGPGRAARF